MGEVRFYPGSLMPPAGFSFFEGLSLQAEEGLHLVAFAEGALDALKDAPRLEAKSVVLLSPLLEGSPLLRAKAEALRFALERGGLEGFARVGRAFFFGPETVGEEALFETWREGLKEEGVRNFLDFVLKLRDERRWLRTFEGRVLVLAGAWDAFLLPPFSARVVDFAKGEAVRFLLEGGFLAPWEAPEEAFSLLEEFLGGKAFRPLPGGLAL
ncbi:MAG: alpha/beta fold hydrolase [Thermaceae bacterium]